MAKNKEKKLSKSEKNKWYIETLFGFAFLFVLFATIDVFRKTGVNSALLLAFLSAALFTCICLVRTDKMVGGIIGLTVGLVAAIIKAPHIALLGGLCAILGSLLFIADKKDAFKK